MIHHPRVLFMKSWEHIATEKGLSFIKILKDLDFYTTASVLRFLYVTHDAQQSHFSCG